MVRLTLTKRKTPKGAVWYYAQAADRRRTPQRKTMALGTTHKAVALQRLRAMQAEVDAGALDPWNPRPVSATLGDLARVFLDDCRSRRLRPDTLRTYNSVLSLFMRHAGEDAGVGEITTAEVRRFCMAEKLSESSRRHRLRHLKAFFAFAVRGGHAAADPSAGVRMAPPKKVLPKLLTPDDVDRILAARDADNEERDPPRRAWFRPLVLTIFHHGLRRGEALRLRWRDVDFDNGLLYVRQSKGGDRVLPLIRPEVLRAWREETEGAAPQCVFSADGGETPLSESYAARAFREYARTAGVSVTKLHGLRHGAATALLAQGASSRLVQQVLGHASIQTTERYLHVVEGEMRRAMNGTFRKES